MDTHNTERCYKLEKIARDNKEPSKACKKLPYSKRTFRKEGNAFVHQAGKHCNIKIVEKAIKREQSKQAKHGKKHEKVAFAKRLLPMNLTCWMNQCITWNPGFLLKLQCLFKNVCLNSKGKVVDIKCLDLEDDCKMPAKISCKKRKKGADPMDTDSESSEDEDSKAQKEEKAFLKSIDKKEITIDDSDSDSD
jgi:hypothetical protein